MQTDSKKHDTPIDANNMLVADAVKMKLTPRQNMIIFCLQNGWSLITQSQTHIVICCSSKVQFEFNSSLLYRLVNMGLIRQSNWHRDNFYYVLTELGQKIITKKVDLDIWM
jgi:hypothetical protein